ncbi:hypothetical protein E2C01_010976 [Portunus trituberculatus]|uniref:Uncharacterized protein n=1 Tax=Portunus trituberculatus TaxID=210409 RepID=A0A5B7DA14_PORTR|nr:hypothetical protein [Portunus trituberculatus]
MPMECANQVRQVRSYSLQKPSSQQTQNYNLTWLSPEVDFGTVQRNIHGQNYLSLSLSFGH